MSVRKRTAFKNNVHNTNDFQQAHSVLIIEQIKHQDILLHEGSISRVDSQWVLLRIYSLDYFTITVYVNFHPDISVKEATLLLICDMSVRRHVLNNTAKVSLLCRLHRLQALCQLQVKNDLRWIQQHMQIGILPWECKSAINKAIQIKLKKLANKIICIIRCDLTLVDLMEKILNFVISFEKNYRKELFVTVDVMKLLIGSTFPVWMSI